MHKQIYKLIILFFLCTSAVYANTGYVLSAGDTIRISVYGEEDLTFEELIIDSSQSFDFPYLGILSTRGKTLKQVQQMITDGLLGDYLVDPKVNVSIIKYRNVYVNGVVNKPGAYEYQPELTVEKAITLAGGFMAKYRKTKGIYLTKNEEVKGLSDDQIKRLLKERETVSVTETVNPGDTIYVVSSFW
ncbi:polysaccharide biosynthesis/export family protein [Vibrio sp. MA40-2]|uniref:polysaccharide biosynthesis/export family protein n=1 Tax=Vibrio sp. MA40-2 TaxID=3391828 RepID=UPI0039A5B4EA